MHKYNDKAILNILRENHNQKNITFYANVNFLEAMGVNNI